MTYRIYGAELSPYLQRVTIQCDYKALAYEVLPPPGGLHSDEFRALNPIGKIPALQLDDGVLPESEVICEYLEDRHPERSLRPVGAEARAKARLIARVVDLYLMAPMNPLFGQLRRSTRDESVAGPALAGVLRGLDLLDGMMEAPFAAGEAMSLADCAAAPAVRYALQYLPMFGAEPLAGRPALAKWWDSAASEVHIAGGITRLEGAWAALRRG